MPRITAATVAEHVAQQEAAVIDAARRLFAARGVSQVTLADIAGEVGLGRTSLYRYFPTKAHILRRWFETVMEPLVAASRAAAVGDGSRPERLARWLDVQLDFLLDPEHAALVAATNQADDLPDDVRDDIAARHRELYATLSPLLPDAVREEPALARTRTTLVAGLIRSAADLVRSGVDRGMVRDELVRTATAALDGR